MIKASFRYTDDSFEDWFKKANTDQLLDEIAYYIGWAIINLNALEEIIDICIQELMSKGESADELIAIFQSELTFSRKVKALTNVYGWHINNLFEESQKDQWSKKLYELSASLIKAGEIRNQYAHAYFHDISANRFVKTKTQAKKDGVYHWFRKFSIKDMKSDLERIEKSASLLDKFDQQLLEEINKF